MCREGRTGQKAEDEEEDDDGGGEEEEEEEGGAAAAAVDAAAGAAAAAAAGWLWGPKRLAWDASLGKLLHPGSTQTPHRISTATGTPGKRRTSC